VAPDAPPAAEFVRAFVSTSPFARRTGLEVVGLSADRAELRLPCAPDPLDATSGATISLTVNYVRAGRGDLVAVGRAVRRAGGLCFCEGEAADAEGRMVATAMATYRYA
jgi:acyl-coenzyme A thioesterase PaaI-like protein